MATSSDMSQIAVGTCNVPTKRSLLPLAFPLTHPPKKKSKEHTPPPPKKRNRPPQKKDKQREPIPFFHGFRRAAHEEKLRVPRLAVGPQGREGLLRGRQALDAPQLPGAKLWLSPKGLRDLKATFGVQLFGVQPPKSAETKQAT